MRGLYTFLVNRGTSVAFSMGLFITITFLMMIFGGLDDFNALSKEDKTNTGIFDFGIQIVFALTFLCFVVMLVFGLIQIFGDLKGSMKGVLGMVAIVVIFMIARSMWSPDADSAIAATVDKFNVLPSESSFISGAITTGLAMFGIAGLTFVLSELRNFFK